MDKNKMKRIMMIGTNLEGKGGIASVVNGYLKSGLFKFLNVSYFPIHIGGSKIEKITYYLYGIQKIFYQHL